MRGHIIMSTSQFSAVSLVGRRSDGNSRRVWDSSSRPLEFGAAALDAVVAGGVCEEQLVIVMQGNGCE